MLGIVFENALKDKSSIGRYRCEFRDVGIVLLNVFLFKYIFCYMFVGENMLGNVFESFRLVSYKCSSVVELTYDGGRMLLMLFVDFCLWRYNVCKLDDDGSDGSVLVK